MSNFSTTYNQFILPAEGGYANIAADKGGETYAGIARNFNPTWAGWTVVDFEKQKKGGTLPNNYKIAGIAGYVEDFYKSWWTRYRIGEIVSQDVANIVFDWIVNSGTLAIKKVQELLNAQFAKGIAVDAGMGNQTLAAINSVDSSKLYQAIKTARASFYQALVAKDPTQATFLPGWMARINKFPDLIKNNPVTSVLFIAGLFFLGWQVFKPKRSRRNEMA